MAGSALRPALQWTVSLTSHATQQGVPTGEPHALAAVLVGSEVNSLIARGRNCSLVSLQVAAAQTVALRVGNAACKSASWKMAAGQHRPGV